MMMVVAVMAEALHLFPNYGNHAAPVKSFSCRRPAAGGEWLRASPQAIRKVIRRDSDPRPRCERLFPEPCAVQRAASRAKSKSRPTARGAHRHQSRQRGRTPQDPRHDAHLGRPHHPLPPLSHQGRTSSSMACSPAKSTTASRITSSRIAVSSNRSPVTPQSRSPVLPQSLPSYSLVPSVAAFCTLILNRRHSLCKPAFSAPPCRS